MSNTDSPQPTPSKAAAVEPSSGTWFFLVLGYIIVDYGRPQDVLPFLGMLKPGMVLGIPLVAYLLFGGRLGETNSPQTRMMWLFIGLLGCYVPLATNNYLAYTTLTSMLLYMPFILSIVVCVDSVKRMRVLILVGVCTMIYVVQYSLRHGGMGSGNYFHDENDLGLYINTWLPFCFYLFFAERSRVAKLLCAVGFTLGLVGAVVSLSRGGFIGLVAVAIVVWLFSPKKIVTTAVLVVAAIAMMRLAGDSYWKEMATVTDTNESTAVNRIDSWKSGWEMFKDNPLGVGGNNFQMRFPEYQGERFTRGMGGRVAHSLWFTLLPETGVLGVVIFLTLLYRNLRGTFILRRANQTSRDPDSQFLHALSLAFLASMAGFFASATFLSVLYYPHYWYLTGIIVAATRISAGIVRNGVHAVAPYEDEGFSSAPA